MPTKNHRGELHDGESHGGRIYKTGGGIMFIPEFYKVPVSDK